MKNPFTAHPQSIGETYFEHLFYAVKSGCSMLIAGTAVIIHGIFPFCFKTTASTRLLKFISTYVERVHKVDDRIISLSECIEKRKQALETMS